MRLKAAAAVFVIIMMPAMSWAIDLEEIDQDRDGQTDILLVETDWYKFEFRLDQTGSAESMIYKPIDHQFRAENYYANRTNMFRDWVRLAAPDPVSGLTRKIGNPELQTATRRLRADYEIVHRTEDELVIEFEIRYPSVDEAPWMDKIRNHRRLDLTNDSPAINAVNTIYNDDDEEHPVIFDMNQGIGLGRVETAVSMPTPDGKLVGRDRAEERGSTFLFAPDLSDAWIGAVNEEGLGAAFSLDWPNVDSMEISMWKTVGSSYVVNMRRRMVPAGGSISFEYTFMPFTDFGAFDGMAGDIAGGILVGEKADLFNNVSSDEVRPGATVPIEIFLACGRNRWADVRIHCARREDGTVVLEEEQAVNLEIGKTTTLKSAITFGEPGLYVLTVTADDGAGGKLTMEKAIEVGRTRLVYTASTPPGEKRGERDAGESIGPATMNAQFRTIDRDFVTQHLPLMKNHANGPVNVFFLTPADSTLGHVRELAQRNDMNYEYIAVGKVQTPPDELNFRDLRDFRQQFRAGDQDVLFTLAIDWSVGLKRQLIRDILDRVEDGMGVVLFVRSMDAQPELKEALENAEEINEENSPLPLAAIAAPQVNRYRYGQGRIVVVICRWSNYRDGGEAALGRWTTIQAGRRVTAVQETAWRGFDYSYVWLGELARWAAKKESSVAITGASLDGDAAIVEISNLGDEAAGKLSVVARTRRWEERAAGEVDIQAAPGASRIRVPLDNPLGAGPHALEIHLRDEEGRVVAFGSAGVNVNTGTTLSIEPSPAYRTAIDAAPLEISVAGGAQTGRIEVEIIDRFGRLAHRSERDIRLENRAATVELDISEIIPLDIYHEVIARFSADEKLMAEAAADLYMIPPKPDYADRFVLGIADGPERRALHIQGVLDAARRAGFTMHTHSHNDAALYSSGGTAATMVMVSPDNRFAMAGERPRLDSANLIMHPALLPTDEALDAFKTKWQQQVRNRLERGAFFIGIDDERRMSGDFDFNPQTLEGFREWIAGRYENIDELNATWGTEFANFGEVMPMPRDRIEGDNLAPWLEFRMFIGRVIGEYYMKAPAEWAAEIDPGLSVGELGVYDPGPNWPVDWSEYAKYYRHTGRYSETTGELIRAFGEGARHGQWQGYGMTSIAPGRRITAWRSLLDGGSFAWFWALVDNGYWNYGLATSDQRITAGYAALAEEEFPDLTGGIDRLILASEYTHDGVAIGYSYPSVLADPSSAGTVSRRIVEELGLLHNYVRMTDVAEGLLEREGYRALIIHNASCLSAEEVEGVRRFAENGGTVLVSGLSGWRDEHGAPIRDERPLDQLLGIDTRGAESLGRPLVCGFEHFDLKVHVAVTGVQAQRRILAGNTTFNGEVFPVFTVRQLGEGHVCWLNSTLDGHSATFTGGVAGEQMVTLEGPEAVRLAHWEIFREILIHSSEIKPRAMILDQNEPLFDTKTWYYQSPSGRTMFIARYLNRDVPGELDFQIDLGHGGHVYDLRENRYAGEIAPFGGGIKAEFPRGRMNVFALLDYRVTGIEANLDRQAVAPGERINLSASVLTEPADPGADLHALRVSLLDSEGKDLEAHRTVLLAENGRAELTAPIALNAAPGEYTFVVFDVTSGMEARATFDVQQ